jgi:hypothetical protein
MKREEALTTAVLVAQGLYSVVSFSQEAAVCVAGNAYSGSVAEEAHE